MGWPVCCESSSFNNFFIFRISSAWIAISVAWPYNYKTTETRATIHAVAIATIQTVAIVTSIDHLYSCKIISKEVVHILVINTYNTWPFKSLIKAYYRVATAFITIVNRIVKLIHKFNFSFILVYQN